MYEYEGNKELDGGAFTNSHSTHFVWDPVTHTRVLNDHERLE